MDEDTENKNGVIPWIIVVLIACGFFAFKFFGWYIFSPTEVTVYPSLCKDVVINNKCDVSNYALTTETYIASNSKQIVFYLDGSNTWQKYVNCTVVDLENWTCILNDNISRVGLTNGKYWETIDQKYLGQYYIDIPPKDVINKTYFLSRSEWILQSCKSGGYLDYVCVIKKTFNIDKTNKNSSDWVVIPLETTNNPIDKQATSSGIKTKTNINKDPLNLFKGN